MDFILCSGAAYFYDSLLNDNLKIVNSSLYKFSNGEFKFNIKDPVSDNVCVIQSVSCGIVNDYLIELLLCLDALRRAGVKNITVVLPYMPYARQDRLMEWGDSVGSKLVLDSIISCGVNQIVTCDLHNERISSFINQPFVNVNSVDIFKDSIMDKISFANKNDFVFVALDVGAALKAAEFANVFGIESAVIHKKRSLTGIVEATRVIGDITGKTCIIIDDIVDSGGTLFKGVELILNNGARDVLCYITHPVVSNPKDFSDRIEKSAVSEVLFANTIHNPISSSKVKYVDCLDKIIKQLTNLR